MLKTIFAQETKAEAEIQWDAVADARREKNDRLSPQYSPNASERLVWRS